MSVLEADDELSSMFHEYYSSHEHIVREARDDVGRRTSLIVSSGTGTVVINAVVKHRLPFGGRCSARVYKPYRYTRNLFRMVDIDRHARHIVHGARDDVGRRASLVVSSGTGTVVINAVVKHRHPSRDDAQRERMNATRVTYSGWWTLIVTRGTSFTERDTMWGAGHHWL